MKAISSIGLKDVQTVYGGPEGDLWELIMGEQVHIGGFQSSMDLAERANIADGMRGIDLCCCNGAGMRFLLRFRGVKRMHGVDATERVLERGRRRFAEQGLADRVDLTLVDACQTGLPTAGFDFVWGEDAWCYVCDKPALIREASRLVKPGGTIAFTDWVEGDAGLSEPEAERFLKFMKFPNVLSISDYSQLLRTNGCTVLRAHDTGRFAPYVDLYLQMLNMQLTHDALRIIGFDMPLLSAMGEEMAFMQRLAHEKKIAQGLFIARRET